jgi:hypothetical protein
LRHQHYEKKRKEKLALILSTINQGALPELQQVFESQTKQVEQNVTSSAMTADLKELLDAEFVLNKKLARQIYAQEMLEKVK